MAGVVLREVEEHMDSQLDGGIINWRRLKERGTCMKIIIIWHMLVLHV